jgi:hypothetical protein
MAALPKQRHCYVAELPGFCPRFRCRGGKMAAGKWDRCSLVGMAAEIRPVAFIRPFPKKWSFWRLLPDIQVLPDLFRAKPAFTPRPGARAVEDPLQGSVVRKGIGFNVVGMQFDKDEGTPVSLSQQHRLPVRSV